MMLDYFLLEAHESIRPDDLSQGVVRLGLTSGRTVTGLVESLNPRMVSIAVVTRNADGEVELATYPVHVLLSAIETVEYADVPK